MSLPFSADPGSRERQLKTRYNNPLFPPERRMVSLGDLSDAQFADHAEIDQFRNDFTDTLHSASELGDHVGSEVILGLKEKCDTLYETACGLGGDFSTEKNALSRFLDVLMAAVLKGAAGDDYALDELAQESTARDIHFHLLEAPIVSDLLRPDTPVAEHELVPTLLSQSASDLRLVLELFDHSQRNDLLEHASTLLELRQSSGVELPNDLNEKLNLIREI